MTYKEARVYLDEVSKYGSVLGLETIRDLLYELDNPQEDLHFIHIAGTNGKGSVLAYISTILSEAGYRIGRYVSPTVVSYLERIQIDGQWIPEDIFTELVERVQSAIAKMETNGKGSPTVFEVETAIAFLYFKKCKCDFVVLETGLGGTLDATNIVQNTEVAVFASISMDHMGFLGDTLRQIAENKAGIMKPGCDVVTTMQKQEVMEVLRESAQKLGAKLIVADAARAELLEESWRGQTFSYEESVDEREADGKMMPDRKVMKIQIPMAGVYQVENALTAYEAVKCLRKRGVHVSDEAVLAGFAKTQWIGRFTCIGENPLLFVDGAHNEDAALRLRESVQRLFPDKKLLFIMGVFKDKEYGKILEIMAPLASQIYTVNLPDAGRTLDAQELKKEAERYCEKTEAVGDIEYAVYKALQEAQKDDVVLAFGSLSYLGQVIAGVNSNVRNRK